MRAVHVVPHMDTGGLEAVVGMLVAGLGKHGVESELLDLEAELEARGSGGKRLSSALFPLAGSLVKRWRGGQVDAVVSHTVLAGALGLSLGAIAGVKGRVLVLHGDRDSLGLAKTVVSAALRATRVANRLVFVGEAARDSFAILGRLPGSIVIRNGVELPPDGQAPGAPVGPDAVDVVVSSRLVPSKRVDVAIDACSRLGDGVRLTICGDGEERAALEQRAETGPGEVTFLGMVDRQTLRAVLERADIVLCPSELEGLPLGVVEAAQAGAAIVALQLAINVEILGEAAVYVSGDDVEEWADAVRQLAQDPDLRRRLGAAAAERGWAFDPSVMIEQYAQLIRSFGPRRVEEPRLS